MSENHAKTPHIFKRGQHVQKTCSGGLYIIYMYIKVCSSFSFVISEILNRYMICPGLIRESSEYYRRHSQVLRVMYSMSIVPHSDHIPPPPPPQVVYHATGGYSRPYGTYVDITRHFSAYNSNKMV